MKWKKINTTSGLHKCQQMDIYLTSCGYTQDSVKYLSNPCQIHDKYLLNDLKEAVDKIQEFIRIGKKIVIIGDYDADGVTSTASLMLALEYCGATVDYIIPHRVKNGYGLSEDLVDKAIEMHANVLLTCDNGITANEAIQYAKDKGLYVIVTDHHTPKEELPKADLIVHPALGDYPFASISGCQTAYKLCMGIIEECSPLKGRRILKKVLKDTEQELKDYLFQLATISIVTDVMPIASADEELAKVNENRQWLIDGIQMIRENPNWRIKKMLKMVNVNQENFEETSIGFYIGPCLNAVGRLTNASKAVEFLIAETEEEARKPLAFMSYINEERKKVKIECVEKVQLDETHKVNLVTEKDLHEGVLGILASHYTNKNGYPSFILTDCEVDGQKAWKGSGRGVEGINLFDTLSEVQAKTSSIYAFGGHAGAVGLTILDRDLEEFKENLINTVEDKLSHSTYEKTYIELSSVSQRKAIADAVKEMKPFGNGLPLPVVEMNYNVKEINLYYKSGHVKFLHKESEKVGTTTKWNNFELWLYNGLETVKPVCQKDFKLTADNIQKLIANGKSNTIQEANAQKYETYTRKVKESRVKYKTEVGYSDFGGMGARFNVVELEFQ